MLTTLFTTLAQAGEKIDLKPKAGSQFAPLGNLTIAGIISGLIRFSLVVAALAFFFILVIGGIRWIISGGDKAQTEAARSQITAALVGLVVVFAAWAIVQLINTFFGVNIFQLSIPSATQ
jgi:hypothetical protein